MIYGTAGPAKLLNHAASFDLPISLGILAGSGQLASEWFDDYAVVGELSLEGSTRPTKGALSVALTAAKQQGQCGLIVPTPNAAVLGAQHPLGRRKCWPVRTA